MANRTAKTATLTKEGFSRETPLWRPIFQISTAVITLCALLCAAAVAETIPPISIVQKLGENPLQYRNLVPAEEDMPAEEAVKIAMDTARRLYLLPTEYFDASLVEASLFTYISIEGSYDYKPLEIFAPIWEIGFKPNDGSAYQGWLDMNQIPEIAVWVSTETKEAVWMNYLGNTYNDLGTSAEQRAGVEGTLAFYRLNCEVESQLIKAERERGVAFDRWTVAERAALYRTYILDEADKQGIKLLCLVHILPPDGAIAEAEAVRIAEKAFQTECGAKAEDLSGMLPIVACVMAGYPDQEMFWLVRYSDRTEDGAATYYGYGAELDVMTGEVRRITSGELNALIGW